MNARADDACADVAWQGATIFRKETVPSHFEWRSARNLPLSRFDASQLPKGDVVIICQAGGRSAKALGQALQAGRKDVRHYQPGTGGWRARGGAVTA